MSACPRDQNQPSGWLASFGHLYRCVVCQWKHFWTNAVNHCRPSTIIQTLDDVGDAFAASTNGQWALRLVLQFPQRAYLAPRADATCPMQPSSQPGSPSLQIVPLSTLPSLCSLLVALGTGLQQGVALSFCEHIKRFTEFLFGDQPTPWRSAQQHPWITRKSFHPLSWRTTSSLDASSKANRRNVPKWSFQTVEHTLHN